MRLCEITESAEDTSELVTIATEIARGVLAHADSLRDRDHIGRVSDYTTAMNNLPAEFYRTEIKMSSKLGDLNAQETIIYSGGKPQIEIKLSTELLDGEEDEVISTITHELRHALDDAKSEFRMKDRTNKYTKPKAGDDSGYWSKPFEINARITQAMHELARQIQTNGLDEEEPLEQQIDTYLSINQVGKYLKGGKNSKDYKRAVNRVYTYLKHKNLV